MRKCSLFSLACCVITFALAAPQRAQADPTLLNGSFEEPDVSASPGYQQGGGTSWTPIGNSVFIISNQNTLGSGTTPYGNQYLGMAQQGNSDQQTVSGFLAGQNFVLDLFYSDLVNGSSPQLTVTLTGAATGSAVFTPLQSNATTGQPLPLVEGQVPFTVTSDGSVTFALIDSGKSNIAVDNLTLQAVPEVSPVFSMILLSGVLASGLFLRFRRRV